MEALCCVETAQPLLMDSALQGDHLAPYFTAWQQEQDQTKAGCLQRFQHCIPAQNARVFGEPSHHNEGEGMAEPKEHFALCNGHCG